MRTLGFQILHLSEQQTISSWQERMQSTTGRQAIIADAGVYANADEIGEYAKKILKERKVFSIFSTLSQY
jgi:hypothetical protein